MTWAFLTKSYGHDQVFAIVSGLTAGAEDGVAALTQEKEVPLVGPSDPEKKLFPSSVEWIPVE